MYIVRKESVNWERVEIVKPRSGVRRTDYFNVCSSGSTLRNSSEANSLATISITQWSFDNLPILEAV